MWNERFKRIRDASLNRAQGTDDATSTRQTIIELLIVSFLSLFIELLVIRWLCSDFRLFTVFRTVPLVTCFVGLGVGLAMRRSDLFKLTPFALLQFAATVKLAEWLGITEYRFPAKATYFFQNIEMNDIGYLAICLLFIVLLLAGPFAICVCLGAKLGVLFNRLPSLNAYAVDITGAIAGSITFGLLCFWGLSPEVLLSGATFCICVVLIAQRQGVLKQSAALLLVCAALFMPIPSPDKTSTLLSKSERTYWSPYQRLDLTVFNDTKDKEFVGLQLGTNRNFYQYYFSDTITPEKATAEFANLITNRRKQYKLPYDIAGPVSDVLILGVGTGQNIAPALAHGAKNVDAVDIDPVILSIGKKYNDSFKSEFVHPICDDARHYLKECNKKYDLIIFTLLDSQAVVGQGSSVRLDTYVYTRDSIKQALSKLKPNGVIVMSFACLPWIAERLSKTIESAAGYPPLVTQLEGKSAFGGAFNAFFVIGSQVQNKSVNLPAEWRAIDIVPNSSTPTLTDDWPYLYVRSDIIDFPYIALIAITLSLSAWTGRGLLFGPSDRNCWRLFLMGSAFMLLELHAISLLSLVYGSTWLTSAIVINGILIMILAANLLVLKFRQAIGPAENTLYLLLLGSIMLSYFTPPNLVLTSMPGMSGELALTLITILPMGLAGMIFPIAFSQSPDSAKALAFNLFGAVIGGLLEYLSNFIGIRNLELIAFALYFASMLIMQPWRGTNTAATAGALSDTNESGT